MDAQNQVIAWREFNIHDKGDVGNEQQDNRDFLFQMFDPPKQDSIEVLEFHFPNLPSIYLEAQRDYTNSTGLALWGGSEVLCNYLIGNRDLICGTKRVMELGAGVGLCGIVAHHLGASHVCLTDGDTKVLTTLEQNVNRNTRTRTSNGITGDDKATSSTVCTQLIWGRNLDSFEHGKQNVIMGSDLVYMTQSLEPLWQTVHKLLETDGLFLYVNMCSSQAPVKLVLETATRYGFTWTTSSADSKEGVVYLFRRRAQRHDEKDQ